jgi:phytoene dehydrogenase-like protein
VAEASYDVIVLGAGLGGLAAALTLLRSGARVLMVESRSRVGGRCQTIRAQQCLLPVGTVVIPCGDFLEGLFTDFQVPFDVVPVPTRGVYEIGGQRIPVPDRGALRTLANAALPGRPEIVDDLLAAVRRALAWAEPSASVSMRDWLSQFVTEPALLSAFQAMSGAYLAANSYEVSARAFIRYLRGAAGGAAIGIPARGWGALVEPLGDRFQELGGDLWTACPVRSIRVDGGRAAGAVIRRAGQDVVVRAPVVVSDLGPQLTVRKVARDAWDLGYADDVAAIPTAPGVALFFRHDEELIEGGGPLLPASAHRACFAITPTMLAPGLGDGHSHWTEVLVTLPDSRIQTVAAAQAAAEVAVREVHELFPALHGRSPFKQLAYRADWPIYRTWPGWEMPYRTPVENLFLVGDAVRRPDQNGTSAAAQSGVLVAGQVLERLAGSRQAS